MKWILFAFSLSVLIFTSVAPNHSWAGTHVKTICAVTRIEGRTSSSKPPELTDSISLDSSEREIKTLNFEIKNGRDSQVPKSWIPLIAPLKKNHVASYFSDSSIYSSNITVTPIGMGPIYIEATLSLNLDDQGIGTANYTENKIDNSRGMVNSISQDFANGIIVEGHEGNARAEKFILEMKCHSQE